MEQGQACFLQPVQQIESGIIQRHASCWFLRFSKSCRLQCTVLQTLLRCYFLLCAGLGAYFYVEQGVTLTITAQPHHFAINQAMFAGLGECSKAAAAA